MYDIRIFFLVLSALAGAAFGIAAICSIKLDYRPPIKPAYGDTSWSAIDEMEEL